MTETQRATEFIELGEIRTDGGTQPRATTQPDRVEQYVEAYRDGEEFPPLKVVFDGTEYWLYDGFHRYHAQAFLERRSVFAEVRKGTKEDAIWLSCAANKEHDTTGLHRTNEDKRKAVRKALEIKPGMSNRAIADYVGVHHVTVGKYREEDSGGEVHHVSQNGTPPPMPTKRTGRDGKEYPMPPPRPPSMPPPNPPHSWNPSNPPPKPSQGQQEADRVYDRIGREIPEELVELWGERHWLGQELLTAVSRVRSAVKNAQEEDDPCFAEVMFSHVKAHLDQAYAGLKVVKPYALCPYCHGLGCHACLTCGLVSKFRWDNACAEELKDAAIEEGEGNQC